MATSGSSHYFYYQDEKVELGPILTDMIIIGFEDGTDKSTKEKIIGEYDFLGNILDEATSGSADVTIVSTRNNPTPGTLEVKFSVLEQNPKIKYASPFFTRDPTAGGRLGITNQFLVTLEDKIGMNLLEKLMKRTNTTLIEPLGPSTYILSADKNSAGNALDMANYFHESPGIKIGEPDFFQNLVLNQIK
jgi:hypothetical protein